MIKKVTVKKLENQNAPNSFDWLCCLCDCDNCGTSGNNASFVRKAVSLSGSAPGK